MLETPDGALALVAGTSPDMLEVEDLERSLGHGPCLEAYRTGMQVMLEYLREHRDRWPVARSWTTQGVVFARTQSALGDTEGVQSGDAA